VEILEGRSGDSSTAQKARGQKQDAMQMVRDLQARIEVKKEVMEEEQQRVQHARRHAQEATELRGRLNDIVLAFECTLCFETLGAGSVSFGCGHTYCNRPTCASRLVDSCPECSCPVTARVQLFGALPDVGGLLEAAAVREEVLATASANATMEDICKEHKEDKATLQRERKDMQRQVHRLREEVLAAANDRTVWQREREEMQGQVNRLREEVLATANANATMGNICKEHEEDKAALQRERKEVQRQVNRLREEVLERDALQGQRNICINRLRELERQLNRLREPLRGSSSVSYSCGR
jgi:hypothetical protein